MPEDVAAPARAIDEALRQLGDPERAAGAKRYLKSDLEFIGVPLPEIRRVVRAYFQAHGAPDRERLLTIARVLWAEPVHERRVAAIEVLGKYKRALRAEDIEDIEAWLRDARTWAYVDPLAIDVAGDLVVRYPALGTTLDRWASDDDFWIRRSALLALLRPIRRGGGDFERFARYADTMLDEREFFIRKAIGWVLRDASKQRPELVFAWLGPRTHRASGVTMREAVKYLPPQQRDQLMAAYRERRPAV